MRNFRQKLLNKKGSVLAFSLIIMGLMLATTISLLTVSSIERKTSSSTDRSNQSFQVADSGVEIMLKHIRENSDSTLSEYDSNCFKNGGVINVDTGIRGGTVSVELFDADDKKLTCEQTFTNARKIKSVGIFAGTTRAIETAVAASGDLVGTCFSSKDMLFIRFEKSCSLGWTQCDNNDIILAGRKGCLPSASQYLYNIKGCLSGSCETVCIGAGCSARCEKIHLAIGSPTGWITGSDSSCTDSGDPRDMGVFKACCKQGL